MIIYRSVVWNSKPDWFRFIQLIIASTVLALDASKLYTESPYSPGKHKLFLTAVSKPFRQAAGVAINVSFADQPPSPFAPYQILPIV